MPCSVHTCIVRHIEPISTAKLARHARDLGYAVPAVNVFDDVSLRAVIAAAESLDAPIIVQVSVKTVRTVGVGLLTVMFENATRNASVPVALHLDHCPDRAVLADVIAERWSSVLFDASDRPLDVAERETREVVDAAHAAGVDVESEIENIVGVEDGVGSDTALHAYSVEQLSVAAELTGADLLAPQLGTSHGQYSERPILLPERARELAERTGLPIVLHGGTGLDDAEFRAFIDAGVSKINISTAVKRSYLMAAARHLDDARQRDRWDPPSFFSDVHEAVVGDIRPLIQQFGAAGRGSAAGKALAS